MKTGHVKFFNEERGWGMITPDDNTEDTFVHFSEINKSGFKTLQQNERVSYEVEIQHDGRTKAKNVDIIEN